MDISPGGPGKSRHRQALNLPRPPGSVPLPEYVPQSGPSAADRFQVAVWTVPSYAGANHLDGAWVTAAWTSTRGFAETIAAGFLGQGHVLAQVWCEGELITERSNIAGRARPAEGGRNQP